jgi:hypothetical protein
MNVGRPWETDITRRLNQVLGDTPFLRLEPVSQSPAASDTGCDLSFDVIANGAPWKLLLEVKSSEEPRHPRPRTAERTLALRRSL